jgi:hypothetical protein
MWSCRAWARRHPGEKKPTGTISYVCQYKYCGKTFTREKLCGKRPRFCGDPCWESYRHYETRPEGYWRVENPYESRWYTCIDCGGTSLDSGYGPVPTRCEECALTRHRVTALRWQRWNPHESRACKAAWSARNPQHGRDREARRRARQADLPYEYFSCLDVYAHDGWICGLCSRPVNPEYAWPSPFSASLDHIIPVALGGPHTLDNVQLAHLRCNIRKGASMV